MPTDQSILKMQDNVAERLKTFKFKNSTQNDTVTTASEAQTIFFASKNPKYNSSSTVSSASQSRPTSHHRRRSSVSTRRESAEMMGVSTTSLVDLPSLEDGDTSNIRRRALWALEGKRDDMSPTAYVGGFSKVEIPELSSGIESDHDRKSQSIYSLNNTMIKRDSLGRERDSYGRVISQALSLKDQLHTLLEEDEEEEATPPTSMQPVHSPAASSSTSGSLPNSSSAPSSLSRNRLKPLTLSISAPLIPASGTPSRSQTTMNEVVDKRRSSFSYLRSADIGSLPSIASNVSQLGRNALPTPESTPTTSERPLSPSEQAFLFNNQASLLSRISELERVLASRSRPMSFASTSSRQLSTSSIASEPQSDELLRLIQDLKTERDELSRELGVSQSKVENLETQLALLNRRVENERKEAWAAKQSEQMVKIENGKLLKELDAMKSQVLQLKEELVDAREELNSHNAFHVHRKDVSMPSSVEQEGFTCNEDGEDELAHYEDEEIGDVSFFSDQDGSTSSSSLNGSNAHTTIFGHPAPSPPSAASISPPHTPITVPATAHRRSSSLEQGWSFPRGVRTAAKTEPPKVDRFFDCLEVLDSEDLPQSTVRDPFSQDKYGFFSRQQDDDEDENDFPFIIPSQSAVKSNSVVTLARPDFQSDQPNQLTPPLSPAISFSLAFPSNRDLAQNRPAQPATPQKALSGYKLPPSLIPKPSPSRIDVNTTHLATPMSVPRVKISPVTPPSAIKSRDQREYIKSPTKLPQLKTATYSKESASSPSNGFQLLKGSSLGFTALANYLPWTSWSGDDDNKEEVTLNRGTLPKPTTGLTSGFNRPLKEVSQKKKVGGKSDQLMLL